LQSNAAAEEARKAQEIPAQTRGHHVYHAIMAWLLNLAEYGISVLFFPFQTVPFHSADRQAGKKAAVPDRSIHPSIRSSLQLPSGCPRSTFVGSIQNVVFSKVFYSFFFWCLCGFLH